MNKKFNIVEYLRIGAKDYPDRDALVMPSANGVDKLSFGELWKRVDAFSVGLKSTGFKEGNRAVVMIPMSIELYVVLLGIIKMGGVTVFVDPWISHRQIANFCAFANPTAFIGIPKSHILRLFRKELIKIPITITTGKSFLSIPAKYSLKKLLAFNGDGQIASMSQDESALITFTSGSSGVPKGANRTHGFLSAQRDALANEFCANKDCSDVIDMPMFPVFALSNLAQGITSVIPDMDISKVAEVDAKSIYEQMIKYKVSDCTASPPFFTRLATYLIENKLSLKLDNLLTGGAPISDDDLRIIKQALPETGVTIVYGSTEAEPVAHISLAKRLEIAQRKTSKNKGYPTGKITDLLQSKIIKINKAVIDFDGDWGSLQVDKGGIGELIVSGNHVCRDYFNNPDAVKENKIIDSDGVLWHRMGDTGYFDEDDVFWLVGRVHSTICREGVFYHAQLIEQAIKNSDINLCQIATFGKKDNAKGELIVVVISVNIDEQRLPDIDSLRDVLAREEIPLDECIITSSKLPLDPRHNSKIDYGLLKTAVANGEITNV